jgi:multidrug efflux system membrane fusion protein
MVRRIIGAAAVLVLAAAVVIWWHRSGADVPHPATPVSPPGIPVTAGTVAAADVPIFLQGIGTVQAYNSVAIKSRVDGQIIAVNFKEGQEVKEGEPLFQIDPRPYQAALQQAQAAKQKDEAQLASAQSDLERAGRLVGSGWQTQQSYDQQKALVGQVQAAIKGDEAQIENARLSLGFTDIRSPIDGRLGAKLVDKGNLVRAGDNTTLVTITELRPIFVSFTVPQDKLEEIRQQQKKAPLAVRAYSSDGKKLLAEGKLTLIDNAIDQATGTIRLKARFDNDDEILWPGAFVNLRLILAVRKGVATVPARTVQQGRDEHYAYVIKPDNTVERRAVEVASVQDGLAVIAKGLSPGERVVVDGQFRLTNGAKVRLLGEAPTGASS